MSDNDNRKLNAFLKKILHVGTPECAVFAGVLAMVLAVLILCVGLWKTLLVAVFVAIGLFIGGVPDKKNKLKNLLNRLFPAKGSSTVNREDLMNELGKTLRSASFRKNDNGEPDENSVETKE